MSTTTIKVRSAPIKVSVNGAQGAPAVALLMKPPVANVAALPASGNSTNDGRVTNDTGMAYRWTGSSWILVGKFKGDTGIGEAGPPGTPYTEPKDTPPVDTTLIWVTRAGVRCTYYNGSWVSMPNVSIETPLTVNNPSQDIEQKIILWGTEGNEIVRVVSPTFEFDADVTAFLNVIEVAKGSYVSGVQFNAIHTFVANEKTAGRWSLHKRIYLPIWGSAAANAVDLVTATSGAWVNNNNMEHGAGFVRSFGPTNVAGHFNTGVSPVTLGMSNSANYFLTVLNKTASAQTFAFPFNATGTGVSECGFVFTGVDVSTVGAPNINAGAVSRLGILANGRHGGTSYFKRKRGGASIVTTTAASTIFTPSTSNFLVTGLSNNGAFNEYATTNELGAYSFSLGMSQADADEFIENLATAWETLTKLTLP